MGSVMDDEMDDHGVDLTDGGLSGLSGQEEEEEEGGGERGQQSENSNILSEADLRRRQEDDIAETSALLSVPPAAACLLLLHHDWSAGKLQDAWFADEDGVRGAVGLPSGEEVGSSASRVSGEEATCGICFDSYPCGDEEEEEKVLEMSATAACGHLFCRGCWGSYIASAVDDGPGCLTLRCPDPACRGAVDRDMVGRLGGERDREIYSRHLLRSYVERSKGRLKWCPAPGCELAIEFLPTGDDNHDVFCACKGGFCWSCGSDAHRPVDCTTVSKWESKNRSELANAEYILAYCKPCPKCRRPIEKNSGCMNMNCTCCGFQFCWLCLASHQNHTGTCNRYEAALAANPEKAGAARRKEAAAQSLERYLHYYERWDANRRSRETALANLRRVRSGVLAAMGEEYGLTEADARFVTDAWAQVAECRRVLAYSYAYGYYLPPGEKAKKGFFEYLQGEAEAGLERLHRCAEEFEGLAAVPAPHSGGTPPEFYRFRDKLSRLTVVTRNYFGNLVRALEGGLEEVMPSGARCRRKGKMSRWE